MAIRSFSLHSQNYPENDTKQKNKKAEFKHRKSSTRTNTNIQYSMCNLPGEMQEFPAHCIIEQTNYVVVVNTSISFTSF